MPVQKIYNTIKSNCPRSDNVRCLKNQTLMLLVVKSVRYFFVRDQNYADPSQIQLRLKGNNKSNKFLKELPKLFLANYSKKCV